MNKIIFPILFISLLSGCGFSGNSLENDIKGYESYYYKENLTCEIINSSSDDDINRSLTFTGLNSESPEVIFSDTGTTSPLIIIYDADDLIVLQLVASMSGSTDTFHINKTSGVFARTSGGSFMDTVYALASKGRCE